MKTRTIEISRDGVWAGEGRVLEDGSVVNCPAVLGRNQDESDEVYDAISDAIEDGGTSGEVERPDGIYAWSISDEE